MLTAENGHLETTQFLVTAGAEIEATNSIWCQTALMLSLADGHVAVAQFLVTSGADLNAKDRYGNTALISAVDVDSLNVVKYLMYSGYVLSKDKTIKSIELILEQIQWRVNNRSHSFLSRICTIFTELSIISELDCAYSTEQKSELPLAENFPNRINLLVARICRVEFSEYITQRHSGMPMLKFKAISSLMRAANLMQISHGFNLYLFMRMVAADYMLENTPSELVAKILSFIVGKTQAVVIAEELAAMKSSSLKPVVAAEEGLYAVVQPSTITPGARAR